MTGKRERQPDGLAGMAKGQTLTNRTVTLVLRNGAGISVTFRHLSRFDAAHHITNFVSAQLMDGGLAGSASWTLS